MVLPYRQDSAEKALMVTEDDRDWGEKLRDLVAEAEFGTQFDLSRQETAALNRLCARHQQNPNMEFNQTEQDLIMRAMRSTS